MKNPYRLLGTVLCIAGAVLVPIFYFVIGSVPLTSVSLSALIIGFTCIALANARPFLSPQACEMLLKTSLQNTAALLEELGLRNKAIYLPSQSGNGLHRAIIPLTDSIKTESITNNIPARLVVRYGKNPKDMAIVVATTGSASLDLLETKPGPSASEIEASIRYILVGVMDIAGSVNININEAKVTATVNDPRLYYEDIWYYQCLGSPLASIIAAITSEALAKPVVIQKETYNKAQKRTDIELEVLP